MILASLIFGSLHWAWAAAALGGITLALAVRGYRRAPGSAATRCLGAGLKTAGVVMLALCLIEPLISSTRPRPGANIFVILADDSQSLQIRDPGASKNRAELLQERFAEGQAWQTRLEQDFDVRRYRFDQRLRSLDDPAELTASGVGSALGSALATVARRFEGRPLAGVLLLTDGNFTDPVSEPIDSAALPPIYAVPLGKASAARDVRIGQVTVSQTNFEQAPVTIRTEIEADGYDGREMVVELFDDSDESAASNEPLQRQTIRIEGSDPAILRFRLRPARAGVSLYRLRVAAETELWQFDSPHKAVEATLANNSKLVTIERPGGPYRVLYVSGRPNWEFKFLRRALEEDTEVQLVGLIRIAKREAKFTFMGDRLDSTNPLYKGFADKDAEQAEQYDEPVLIRLGTRDDAELRDGFPKTADELFAYHAVIIDDLEAAAFTQDQMLLLKQFVSRRGGGLLMLGGAESFRQGGYRHTPVAELLPVYVDSASSVAAGEKYRLALTREGWLQPWVRIRQTEENERRRRASMANLQTVNRIHRIKPGATTLARVTDENGGSHPALVVQRFGKGRAAALLAGDLWRWQLGQKQAEDNDLAKAWRQTVRWLVADVPRRVEITTQRKADQPGAPIELKVEVRDPEFKPLDNATVELIVEKPDGQTQTLQATPSDEQAGTYLATFAPRLEGGYKARANVTAADSSVVGSGQTGWTAQPAAEEFARLAPDLALLKRLAEETGGEVIPLEKLERFVSDLPNRKIPITEPWIYPLWHQPAVFLLAIACLIGEWGLRRWKGLP